MTTTSILSNMLGLYRLLVSIMPLRSMGQIFAQDAGKIVSLKGEEVLLDPDQMRKIISNLESNQPADIIVVSPD